MARRLVALLALPVMGLLACSSKGPGNDGETDVVDDPSDAVEEAEIPTIEIDSPLPPDPPVFTPCPEGWREVTDVEGGFTVCDPWPETGPAECGIDEAHLPGTTGCARVGPACPAGDWADDLPATGTVIHVLAGADTGGDGSQGAPFATIAEAVAGAPSGAVIALGKGTYEETLTLRSDHTYWGACVAETLITFSDGNVAAGIVGATSRATLRNVRVSGDRPGFFAVGTSVDVVFENVIIDGAQSAGVAMAYGAKLSGTRLVVRNTRPRPDTGMGGYGFDVELGASATLSGGAIESNRHAGVYCFNTGSSVTLTDVAVRDTIHAQRRYGAGLDPESGCVMVATRVAVEGNQSVGVIAYQADVTLEDVVIRDTLPQDLDLMWGSGIEAQAGSVLSIDRVFIDGNRRRGLLLVQSQMTATDLVISGTQGQQLDGMFGQGLEIQQGCTATVTRAVLHANTTAGVVAGYADTTLTMSDIVVTSTRPRQADATMGVGMQFSDGLHADIERLLVADCAMAGIIVGLPGTTASLTDAEIRDTTSRELDGWYGRALHVEQGAHVEILRGLLENNSEATILVAHLGSTVTASHLSVLGTLERGCAPSTCPDSGYGAGVVTCGGGHAELTTFEVAGSALCGVQIAYCLTAAPGTVDLHHGLITRNPVGVNVQDDGFDIDRLTDDVIFHDNDRNLDSTYLPVPSADLPW